MIYLGVPVSQLDGSTFAHSNCVAACTSEAGDCSSLGFWNVKPATIRKLTGDTSGGLSYDDCIAALKKATGGEVALSVLYWAPESTLEDLVTAGRVVGLSIHTAVTRYTPYRTGTYVGRHNVIIGAKRYATITRSDGTKYQQKQGYVMDPGRTTARWEWWPWTLILQAANRSTETTDKIHVYYTRDLVNVKRTVDSDGSIRATASDTATKVGTVSAGQIYTVLTTVKGGTWGTTTSNPGNGWSKIGTSKYVNGRRLR